MGIDLVGLLAVFSIFFVPISAFAFIVTTRYAFKPLVETLAKAMRESSHGAPQFLPQDNAELMEQIELLREEVRQLRDVREFDRKLLAANTSLEADSPP